MAYVAVVVRSRLAGHGRVARGGGHGPRRHGRWPFSSISPCRCCCRRWCRAGCSSFTLSLDDLVISSFVSGPGATTLPMLIFAKVRLGVTPDINAIATIIIALVVHRRWHRGARDSRRAVGGDEHAWRRACGPDTRCRTSSRYGAGVCAAPGAVPRRRSLRERDPRDFPASVAVRRPPEPDPAQRGDYFLFEIAGESVIIVRDQQGGINALLNVCRHRGSRICDQPAGHEARLVCRYHGWTYGLDGALRAAAHMPADFDRPGWACAALRSGCSWG